MDPVRAFKEYLVRIVAVKVDDINFLTEFARDNYHVAQDLAYELVDRLMAVNTFFI
jgi:hypothetical protein